MVRHWKVYIARRTFSAEPITLKEAAEERRYGCGEPNLIVQARNETEARLVTYHAQHRSDKVHVEMRGPRKAVPVQVPSEELKNYL